MEFTGERMVPEGADSTTFWEHVYRYRFAAEFVAGKAVLDIACGEGYGAAALKRAGASRVIGVDVSTEACSHAAKKYGLETRVGDGRSIPVNASSVDVVTSFETIEHIAESGRFLDECRRVLRPRGTLVISTPNREAAKSYSPNNPFHLRELSVPEFKQIMETRFDVVAYYAQRLFWAAWWNPRGVAAISWPTRRLRGLGRLVLWFRCLAAPHLGERGTVRARKNVIDAILRRRVTPFGIIDPYTIRKLASSSSETPLIVIAVGVRK